jgi:hypothetical protein
VSAFHCEREAEQLCKATIVVVARWAVAIALDPFRMLDEERIVHLALKLRVSRNLSDDIRGRDCVHRSHLSPFVAFQFQIEERKNQHA